MKTKNSRKPLALAIASVLATQAAPVLAADNITIQNSGPAIDDGLLGVADGTIAFADGPAFTVISEGALQSVNATTNIVLQANNGITLNNLADNVLNLAQTASASVMFTANAGAFTMNFGDTIQTAGGSLAIQGASITLGAINTSGGTFSALASGSGNVLAGPIVTGSGAARFGSTNGNITASHANNSFGLLEFDTAGTVFIQEANSTNLTATSTAGSLTLLSAGSISNNAGASLLVTNNAALQGTSVTLGIAAGSINFGSVNATATAGAVTIDEDSAMNIAGLSATTNAVMTAAGNITDAGNIAVTGAANFTSSGDIVLGNAVGETTNFGTLAANASSVGGNIDISEDSAMSITQITTSGSGTVRLQSSDTINDGDDVGTNITAANAVALIAANGIGTSSALQIGNISNLTLDTDGSFDASVTGELASLTMRLNPGTGANTYLLTNGGLDSFAVDDTGTGLNVAITDADGLDLTVDASGGSVNFGTTNIGSGDLSVSGSLITDAGDVSVGGAANFIASGAITLGNGLSEILNFGSLNATSTAGAVTVAEDSAMDITGLSAATTATMSAAGSITDTGNIAVTGAASFTANGDIVLGNAAGETTNFGTLVANASPANGNIDITEDSAMSISQVTTAGSGTVRLQSSDTINDNDDVGTNITAANAVTLSAINGIGTTSTLQIGNTSNLTLDTDGSFSTSVTGELSSLTLNLDANTGANIYDLVNGGLDSFAVTDSGAGLDVAITDVDGLNLAVDASGGFVNLGSMSIGSGGLSVSGSTITDAGNVTALGTANFVASGNITLGDGASEQTHFGTLNATSTSGSVIVKEDSAMNIGQVTNGVASVFLQSSSAINDTDDVGVNIASQGAITLAASTGIGTTSTLQVGAPFLALHTQGGFDVNASGELQTLVLGLTPGSGVNTYHLTGGGLNNFAVMDTGAGLDVAVTDIDGLNFQVLSSGPVNLSSVNTGGGQIVVSTTGAITDSGNLLAGSANFMAGTGNITLGGVGKNTNFGTLRATTSGGNIDIREDSAMNVNEVTTSGLGAVRLESSDTINDIDDVGLNVAAQNVTLIAANGIGTTSTLQMGNIAHLGLDTDGSFDVSVTSELTSLSMMLEPGTGSNTYTLSNGGLDFFSVIDGGADLDVTVIDMDGLDLSIATSSGAVNFTYMDIGGGDLAVTTAGPITDSADLSVGGTTILNAIGQDIALDSASNDFTGAVSVSGRHVALTDMNALTLGMSTVTGNLNVNTGGTVNQTGAVSVAGTMTASSTTGSVAYAMGGNQLQAGLLLNNTNLSMSNGLVTGAIDNNAMLTVTDLLVASNVQNDGAIHVNGMGAVFSGAVVNSGQIDIGNGSVAMFNEALTGAGSFTGAGTAQFNGVFGPGNGPANVSIAADAIFGSTGTLAIEIGGLLPGTEYDRVTVGGNATLGGTLSLSLLNGFTPVAGDAFDILLASSYTGTFSQFLAPTIAGLQFDLIYGADFVRVAATSTVPVPAAGWLFGSGLLGLIGMARRKAA